MARVGSAAVAPGSNGTRAERMEDHVGRSQAGQDGAGWSELYSEVVATGTCTGCGGCIVACPFGTLEYRDFRPWQVGADGQSPGECSRGVDSCGVCTRACPRFRNWEAEADTALHGRVRAAHETFGIARSIVLARAADPAVHAAGQDGGVVSALLCWGLESGGIDGAVTAARHGQRPWEGTPVVAVDRDQVLAAAGSRYTYCPTPLALTDAVARGLGRIALVGTSCQASVPAVMGARRLNKWRRRIAWTFGLLCSKTFDYDSLMEGRIRQGLGVRWEELARMDIKGRMIVERADGQVTTFPLKEAHAWTRDGCKLCPDFAAQHADISFGGLGQTDRTTLVIVRTELGERLWNNALAEGVVEARPVPEETLAMLERLSAAQRSRWPGPDGSSGSGTAEGQAAERGAGPEVAAAS